MGYCSIQTLNGLDLACERSKGGIKKIYVANYADVEEVKANDAIGEIDSIIMKGNAKFKPYSFRKETGSMTSTLNVDDKTGLNYVSTELNLVFTKLETKKRMEISSLSLGQLAVIVEDCNGVRHYLGYNNYVSVSGGTAQTGTAFGDASSYNLTLIDVSDDFPFPINTEEFEKVIEKEVVEKPKEDEGSNSFE